ncbi:Dual-specificity kinase, spindle pole body (SPB) duplication and spindle checkpoint function [Trichophyton interdigitale]|uniref:Dual-specificity kinase, spindle pole body (SPB) duplication and spindle checkpoint function n=1 Tax=Trichophyton interdigitale TaxID=101480 RepID=A0A9P5D0X1_9EURO|nr:Dual-specificity kinase, spindle pole body (SPB) duplication and spindle checkpoint function [Trichophyton interdigitale]KAF3899555.1 Dual-specificity kinase, spindle pole body (SPB) duplication and spindle checkpoint function [Trichophyton interdigitale]KAG8210968.1 Dual-specificity kinase, spindle pole body (SPB) duplication and spindle checkpoint function [Trichophyton interdigitale]
MASPTPLPTGHRRFVPSSRVASHPSYETGSQWNYNSEHPSIIQSRTDTKSRAAHADTIALGDSSDDEAPEPIAFSKSVLAILTDSLPQEKKSGASILQKDSSSSKWDGNSPRGSESSSSSRKGESRGGVSSATSTSRNDGSDLITPAPRQRVVRISRSRSSNQTPSPRASPDREYKAKHDDSQHESHSPLRHRTHASKDHAGAAGERAGPRSMFRPRKSDEVVGMQSSIRVKRVGKLTGEFLNGPARRGMLPRRSEERQCFENEEQAGDSDAERGERLHGHSPSLAALENSVGRKHSPAGLDQRQPSPVEIHTPPHQPPYHDESYNRESKPKAPRVSSPVYPTPGLGVMSRSNPKESVPPADIQSYHIPPPSQFSANREQENEPPPTFKKSKAQHFDMLDRVDKPAIKQDPYRHSHRSTPQDPDRKPLGSMSTNVPTPHRAPPPPPKMTVLETATAAAGAASSSSSRRKKAIVTVNHKAYTRLDCIGRGGSSRVYRVMAENCKIFALKRVNLEHVDPTNLAGYKGEIDLLKKLEKVERVVRLLDYEINEEKETLSVLMEMGESDLHTVIRLKVNAEDSVFDPAFARFYWKEMLECVQAVHEFDIVHADLKPANFLLVKGKLKLIDFGIADTIEDHTVNVHREHQVGTPNYMAPEAIVDYNATIGLPSSAGKMMKIGKPSDVWSLSCILYQMAYGRAPFGHLAKQMERVLCIANPKVAIEYPSTGVGGAVIPPSLIRTLKKCLQRDPTLRPTTTQLLDRSDPFIYPPAYPEGAVPVTQEALGMAMTKIVSHCRLHGIPKDEEVIGWSAGLFQKLQASAEQGYNP